MGAEGEDVVLVERNDSVAWVVLNRPERRNALNERLVRRLDAVLVDLESAEWCRAVVLMGAGKSFCAGGDLNDNVDPEPDAARAARRHGAFVAAASRLAGFPKPTVAAVQGAASGAGASLPLLCDQIVLHRDAWLAWNFLQVGLPPDLLSVSSLQRRLGWTVAADLLHSGRALHAEEAARIGLGNHVEDGDDLLRVATARAAELGAIPPFAFAAAKAMLGQAANDRPDAGVEALYVGIATATPEFRAITAKFRDA